jgi:hypothetical protein
MADNSTDPVAMWHKLLEDMEKGFNTFAGAAVGSEPFSRTLNQVGGASVGAQKTMGAFMERYLTSLNLPSRSELVGIGERLQAIEARVNEIAGLLNRLHPEAAASGPAQAIAPKPRRTKQPPSKPAGREEP